MGTTATSGPEPARTRARRRRCARGGGARAGGGRTRSTPPRRGRRGRTPAGARSATVAGSTASPARPALRTPPKIGMPTVLPSVRKSRAVDVAMPRWRGLDAVLGREQRRLHARSRRRCRGAAPTGRRRRSDELAVERRRAGRMATVIEHAAGDRPGSVPARARDQPTGDERAEGGAEHERHEHQPGPGGADRRAPPARTGARRRSRTTAAGRW